MSAYSSKGAAPEGRDEIFGESSAWEIVGATSRLGKGTDVSKSTDGNGEYKPSPTNSPPSAKTITAAPAAGLISSLTAPGGTSAHSVPTDRTTGADLTTAGDLADLATTADVRVGPAPTTAAADVSTAVTSYIIAPGFGNQIPVTATAADAVTFSIVPGTDLTTAEGIGGAVNRLVTFIEYESSGGSVPSILSAGENDQQQVAVTQIFNAISAFIAGDDDFDIKETMIALGAPETRVVGNLTKLLHVLVKIVSSPSGPSYSVTSCILVKTLVAVQTMMRCRGDDPKTSHFDTITSFGDAGLCGVVVEILKKYNLNSQPEIEDVPATRSLVLTQCCKTIRNVAAGKNVRKIFEKVPGSINALVDVLKTHGLSDAAVAEACCDAMTNINSGFYYADIQYDAVANALVDVLKAHGCTNAGVAKACCYTIHSGNEYGHFAKKRAFVSTDLIAVLVHVIKSHCKINTEQSRSVLYRCLSLIRWLCFLNFSNRAKFAKLKTIEIIESKVTVSVGDQRATLKALGKDGLRMTIWGKDIITTEDFAVCTVNFFIGSLIFFSLHWFSPRTPTLPPTSLHASCPSYDAVAAACICTGIVPPTATNTSTLTN